MASQGGSSSASQVVSLPLVDCTKCKIQVVKRISKAGNVYYSCPKNVPNDATCGKYWFEAEYLEFLRENYPEKIRAGAGLEEGTNVAACLEEPAAHRLEVMNLKVEMCELKLGICELKQDVMEFKQEVKEQVKELK